MNHPLTAGEGPLYRRLATGLQKSLHAGQYQPGQRLPSARSLQRELGLSLNTIHQAMRLLEAEGWVEVRAQAGCYVLPRRDGPPRAVEPIPVRRSELAQRLLKEMNEATLTRLGGSIPNPELLPTRAIRRLVGRLSRQDFPNRYDLPTGSPELRQQIARLSLNAGITVEPDQVLLSGGCQEAVVACLALLCREGDTVAVESPTFYGYLEALELLRLQVLEIPSDEEGLRVDLLRHSVACVLVTPNFANPQGTLMTRERRQQLLELDVPIIENDIQGELHYSPHRPLALRALDGRVFYCSSFSKTLGPEARVGWVLAGPHQAELERSLTYRSFGSSALLRAALGQYLASGDYARRLNQARRTYARQARLVHDLLRENLPAGSVVHRPQGGKMLWVELPPDRDALQLYRECRRHDISVSPGHVYATDERFRHCLRVNCSYWNEAGLKKLCALTG